MSNGRDSTTQATQTPSSDSLWAIRIGVCQLSEYAKIVNWRNQSNFQLPDLQPWAALANSGNLVKEALKNEQVARSLEPAHQVHEETRSASVDATQLNLDAAPASETVPEPTASSPSTSINPDSAKISSDEPPNQSQAAQEQAAQERAAQERAAQERAAQERAAQERAAQERAAQDRATQERAAQERAAQEQAAQERAAQEKAAQERAAQEKADQEQAAQHREKTSRVPEAMVAQAPATSVAIEAGLASQQQHEQTENIPNTATAKSPGQVERKPLPVSPVRSNVYDGPVNPRPNLIGDVKPREIPEEDYLRKLERLVLQLNLELGQRTKSDNPVQDHIESLSQRILDLNLENLALRQELEMRNR